MLIFKYIKLEINSVLLMVGMEGVEPPRLSALGSKPSVSTSSTTSPERERIILQNREMLRSFMRS